jgi:hypothetical protein
MNDVTKATEPLHRLEAEFAKATDRATTLQTERRKISFAAHDGDAKAKSRLAKLNAESLESGLQIENLLSAVDEAKAGLLKPSARSDWQRSARTQWR